MFCPVCKAEYRPGFTQCFDCNVALVDTLDHAVAADNVEAEIENAPASDLHLVWRGRMEESGQEIRALLDAAKIPSIGGYYEPKLIRSGQGAIFWVAVRARDSKRALDLIADRRANAATGELPADAPTETIGAGASGRNPLTFNQPVWGYSKFRRTDAPSESDVLEAPLVEESYPAMAADQAPDELPPEELPAEIQPEDTVVEIWSGESRDTADFLKMCLRENNIAFTIRNDGGKLRLSVEASDAVRAKEIVREITLDTASE